MTFIFKIIFYLFAIIFIVDRCGASSDETASSKRSVDISPTGLRIRNTKPPYWDHQIQKIFNHLYLNKIQISLEFSRSDNDLLEAKNTLSNLFEGEEEDREEGGSNMSARFGEVKERAAAVVSHPDGVVVPKSANCIPEVTTVETVHNDDPSVVYIPSCTRMERCGGCCSDPRLSCQPTKVEMVSLQVFKTQFQGGNKLRNLGRQTIQLEKHTKCKCQCRIQEKDCTSKQSYNKTLCGCFCPNHDEERQCWSQSEKKMWNSDTCRCECRMNTKCSTGYTFDTHQCSCTKELIGGHPHIPQSRSFSIPFPQSRSLNIPLPEATSFNVPLRKSKRISLFT